MNVWMAFGLTAVAGLATGIGSVIAFAAKRTNTRFLSLATGFSAGVMLYVSFVEILVKGAEQLTAAFGPSRGQWINVAAFFGGILLIGVIDALVPAAENPHETHSEEETAPLHGSGPPRAARPPSEAGSSGGSAAAGSHDHGPRHGKLLRLGLFTAVAIAIHNFPEGLATFLAALRDPTLGVAITVAIALHNIPEGISVSVPIYYATGNRRKAFAYSLLSGLAEPFGAGVAYLVLCLFTGGGAGAVPPAAMGILFAAVAGIMVYISLDELLPASRAYGKSHDSLFGLVAGMLVMALSLLLTA
jgi:ZIP family zinc transporter